MRSFRRADIELFATMGSMKYGLLREPARQQVSRVELWHPPPSGMFFSVFREPLTALWRGLSYYFQGGTLLVGSFEVTDIEKMSTILEVLGTLDRIRWSQKSERTMINYCRDDLTDDEKLLTHWLCYIMDRQMSTRRVWEAGGYIVSHIVHDYTTNRDKEIWEGIIKPHLKEDEGKFKLRSDADPQNARVKLFVIESEVSFSSRYMPEDLLRIYRTLIILERVSDRSFGAFLRKVLEGSKTTADGIKRMAILLNRLTYDRLKRDRSSQDASKKNSWQVTWGNFKSRRTAVETDDTEFSFETGPYRPLSDRKRLWCCIRDYLKSPEFNSVFLGALKDAGFSDLDRWRKDSADLKQALSVLELPGDVWNNSPAFGSGLIDPYISDKAPKKMPQKIRKVYDFIVKSKNIRFYPEQFDVTFDFVPRMCERDMCDVCLFGGGVKSVCHASPGVLCSVVLSSCGYIHPCEPEKCSFKNDPAGGLCRVFMERNSQS
ncbi:MAG: hypothetical protein ACTSVT_10375, partial [Candidatus Thorarchaeota archaeon]